MVTHTGTADRPARIRSLNSPRPLLVESDENSKPIAIHLSGRRLAMESLLETWRIDDEWWREQPVSRVYWRILLNDGRTADIYRDVASGKWFRQTY